MVRFAQVDFALHYQLYKQGLYMERLLHQHPCHHTDQHGNAMNNKAQPDGLSHCSMHHSSRSSLRKCNPYIAELVSSRHLQFCRNLHQSLMLTHTHDLSLLQAYQASRAALALTQRMQGRQQLGRLSLD